MALLRRNGSVGGDEADHQERFAGVGSVLRERSLRRGLEEEEVQSALRALVPFPYSREKTMISGMLAFRRGNEGRPMLLAFRRGSEGRQMSFDSNLCHRDAQVLSSSAKERTEIKSLSSSHLIMTEFKGRFMVTFLGSYKVDR